MTNLNAEIINWIQFAKGDLPGHEFHGNQYTVDGFPAGDNQYTVAEGGADMPSAHMASADAHRTRYTEIVDKLTDRGLTNRQASKDPIAEAHYEAIQAHEEAGQAHLDLETDTEVPEKGLSSAQIKADYLTKIANAASNKADSFDRTANNNEDFLAWRRRNPYPRLD